MHMHPFFESERPKPQRSPDGAMIYPENRSRSAGLQEEKI